MEQIPTLNDLVTEATIGFKEHFGNLNPTITVYSPGRVNIIGEHTDYNDGFVLPMAIPLYTVIVGRPRDNQSSKICSIVTLNSEFHSHCSIEFPVELNAVKREQKGPKWSHYVMGVVAQFKVVTIAFEAAILSSVPVGSGLSSSAALEVAMHTFLETLNPQVKVNDRDKAIACQEAEHVYAGVPCGIMDQFICVMGRELHALFLDCRDMSTELICLRNPAIKVLITDSGFRHELVTSHYAERRAQCEMAAKYLGVSSLRDANLVQLEDAKGQLELTIYKRARHVITENERVQEFIHAMDVGDFLVAGRVLKASHESLRHDFEVSCPEIDSLVSATNDCEGVYGCRMTGGGFGGCTISLVRDSAVQEVVQRLKASIELKLRFFVCNPVAGCGVLS